MDRQKVSLSIQSATVIARRAGLLVVLAGMSVGFSLAEPAFSSISNLLSVLQAIAVVAILGVGVTLSLSVGGFDLSVGSVAASAVMAASYAMVVAGLGAVETIGLVMAMGLLVGAVNGALIVRLGIPDLLATLSMMFLLAGLQLIPTGGRSITAGMILPSGETASGAYDPAFFALGRARLWDIVPMPVVIMVVVAALFWLVTARTRWGRVFYAIGGNETAAHLAGAPTGSYRVAAYAISGTLAALGGLIIASRVGRGDVSSGASLLMDSVAAALIGYAVLDQRRPNVVGAVVGAVFVGILLNGLTMLNVHYYTQDFVKGAVLVGALALTFGFARR